MLFSVNSNINTLLAQKNLMRTNAGLNKSVSKLSTGSRINDAADDAAGLSIGESLKQRTNGYREARSGSPANNGILTYQKTENPANQAANIVKRMRELAVQFSSETLATDEREYEGAYSEIGAYLTDTAIRSLQVPMPSEPMPPEAASRSVDLARTGIMENPRLALEAQANQKPERLVLLLD
jgi:hypothetical protein